MTTRYKQKTSNALHRAIDAPFDKRKWNRYFNRVEKETCDMSNSVYSVRHRKWALKTFPRLWYEDRTPDMGIYTEA